MSNHNDNIEQKIKEDWFKNHKATLTGGEGLQCLMWQEPGTWMYGIKYVFSGYNVFISGDLGEAVYNLTCPATIDNIKDFHLGYFTSKMTAFCEEKYDFDYTKAKKELDEYWEEYEFKGRNDDFDDLYADIVDAMSEANSSMRSYQMWLMADVYNKSYPNIEDSWEIVQEAYDFGKKLNSRLIAYWVGLQMAIKQLRGENANE